MAAADPVKALVVDALAKKHTATVIFIHGLGDTGHGWKPVAQLFQRDPALSHVKWIFPHSPTRSVTANLGIEMPSWFDIYSFGFSAKEDEENMLISAKTINEVITKEITSGTPPERIVLGGFSQGACMALLTGLRGDRKLAGIVALSAWLPLQDKLKALASKQASSIPVFWGHGEMDPLIKLPFAKSSADLLVTELGMPRASGKLIPDGLSWNLYRGVGHTTGQEELNDLKEWIKNAIPESAS